MCSKNKSKQSIWTSADCAKDIYSNVLTYNKIFDKKQKTCRFNRETIEFFKSPFTIKKVTKPSWIAYDTMILRFFAYFQEPILESSLETYRVHHCEIRFYLEDDTIDVNEPRTYDPGYHQGKFIYRNKIPLSPPSEDEFYTLDHLNVGCEIEFYGKRFFIYGCDGFTRRFLNRRGTPVPYNLDPPPDLATENRKASLLHTQFTKRSGVMNCRIMEKGLKFFNNTRKVLRFWGYWDDRCNYKGHLRKFVFLYHLEDDTIEILEILDEQDGDTNPLFLKRQRLLKNSKDLLHLPGFTDEAYEVLNMSQLVNQCGEFTSDSFLTDRLYTGHPGREAYTDKDFGIGATISVYGRAFILTETDEFTKSYYRDRYGVEDFTPLVLDEPIGCHESPTACPGGLAQSSLEVDNVGIKPSQQSKLMSLLMDPSHDVLMFSASIPDAQHKVNSERLFTIKYFIIDSSIQILEHQHPNTGNTRGNFLARTIVKRSNNISQNHSHRSKVSEYYLPEDMFVGNMLDINGFQFILLYADDRTLSYMEHHYSIFPQSNLKVILDKVREAFGPYQAADILLSFETNDRQKNGVMSVRDFRCLVLDLTKESLSEHEIQTIVRGYRVTHPQPPPDMETLRCILHTELKKFRFDRFLLQRLEYTFRHYDTCRSGYVERDLLRQLLKGARLPVRPELINFLVDQFEQCDDPCRVNYCVLLKYLDWETYEIPEAKPAAIACIMKHICPKSPPVIDCVNYRCFLDDVCPNINCDLPIVCCPCSPAEYAARAGYHDQQAAHEATIQSQELLKNSWNSAHFEDHRESA